MRDIRCGTCSLVLDLVLNLDNLAIMVQRLTNFTNIRLGCVFRSPFQGQRGLKMHDANNETLAMVETFHVIESITRK